MGVRVALGAAAVALGAALFGPAAAARGADPDFVGVLALAVEADAIRALELSPEQSQKLLDIVDARETAALELALSLRELPAAERAAKLAPYVAESEKLGLALLNAAQQAKLRQLRVARAGMISLAETPVAAAVGLSPEQIAKVADILKRRDEALLAAPAAKRDVARVEFERELAALLSPAQRAAWEKLAGLAIGDAPASPPTDEKQAATRSPAKQPADPASEPVAEEPPAPEALAPAGALVDKTPPSKTPAVKSPTEPVANAPKTPSGEAKLRFNFRFQPWKDVLDWFARQADLSLTLDAPPPGTFNYSDTRDYTPAEALDLINSVLLTKGYTLVRRERLLMLVNLEDGVPPALVEKVTPAELDRRGKYELVSCVFQLAKLTPDEGEKEVRKFIGPQGAVVALPTARQLLVTETVGTLRAIRSMLETAENPPKTPDEMKEIVLRHVAPHEFLALARPLVGLPDDGTAMLDGSLRISIDALGGRLLVTGQPEKVARLQQVLALVDVPSKQPPRRTVVETPQLEVYPVGQSDPAAVLQVMQTLLAGQPDVRLATDPKTGNLVALARPLDHATIRTTLAQMQRDGNQVEVFVLRRLDPQAAVLAINKLFGGGEGAAPGGPKVEADVDSKQLLLRGSAAQIEQVRELLKKMGESTDPSAIVESDAKGNVRMIPLTGRAARMALEQVEAVWAGTRPNRVRVMPRGGDSGLRQYGEPPTVEKQPPLDEPPAEQTPPTDKQRPAPPPVDDDASRAPRGPRSGFVALLAPDDALPPSESQLPDETPKQPPAVEKQPPGEAESAGQKQPPVEKQPGVEKQPPADIIVTMGPSGIMIASQDLEALDEFEALLQAAASRAGGAPEYAVFYLKYAKADVAAELLQQVLGVSSGGDSGGGSMLGDLASAALGDVGGGLFGGLFGMGGSSSAPAAKASGSVTITADTRLNALIVQANDNDLGMIEELLEIIDRESSPEKVQTAGVPRLIPVYNTAATEIANVVKQVYADRVMADPSQPRQPSPEEFLRALGGGRRGRSSSSSRDSSKPTTQMTLGVDTRSNSLIVAAPEQLFQEVKALVAELDEARSANSETVRVVQIKRTNPALVQRALAGVVGDQVRTNVSQTTAQTGQTSPFGFGQRSSRSGMSFGTDPAAAEQMRQRFEMFNMMRRMSGDGSSRSRGDGSFQGGSFQGFPSSRGGR